MNTVRTAIFALFVALVFAGSVNAQYGQYEIPPSFNILIDKTVSKAGSESKGGTIEYVDNLTTVDPRLSPLETVWFRLVVKNTSNTTLADVTVKDNLPGEVEWLEGGSYDSSNHTITINAGDFAVSEEKTYFIKTRVKTQANLPADKGLFCVTNRAEARNDKSFDEDTAQLCIEKQVLGQVTQVPSAGPEHAIAIYSLISSAAYIGLRLRKI